MMSIVWYTQVMINIEISISDTIFYESADILLEMGLGARRCFCLVCVLFSLDGFGFQAD